MNNNKPVNILAIETSCDETAAAVTRNGLKVLSSIVSSQIDWHQEFGGVVPEIASRKHLEHINPVMEKALETAEIEAENLDAVAVTYGPGLVGALLVGISAAKALAYSLHKPLIAVNHIAGHIYASYITNKNLQSPLICLTVSGGHTDLLYFEDLNNYKILGRTRDDAAGEAFDKIARYLELGYPGGPLIEKQAQKGDPEAIDFPRAVFKEDDTYDFSFSGLKTAVINYVHQRKQKNEEINISDIAASFQQCVIDMLMANVCKAVKNYEVNDVILSGGVAANQSLRKQLTAKMKEFGINVNFPDLKYCTDNAAMIGAVAYYQYVDEDFAEFDLNPEPKLSL